MKTKQMFKVTVVMVTFFILLGTHFSHAEEWPSKPITIVVPWGAGGAADVITRMLAEGLERNLGVPVIVENKSGGSGLIGAGYVARAKPDGYTLMFLSCTAITEKAFVRKIPFDPVNGFSFICQVFDYSFAFAVRSDAPWKTFPEFVEAAKKQPGKLTVSTVGAGSTHDVALTKLEAKIPGFKVTHVPYKSPPMVSAAVLGGHVDACIHVPDFLPHVNAGKLRLLASHGKRRL